MKIDPSLTAWKLFTSLDTNPNKQKPSRRIKNKKNPKNPKNQNQVVPHSNNRSRTKRKGNETKNTRLINSLKELDYGKLK